MIPLYLAALCAGLLLAALLFRRWRVRRAQRPYRRLPALFSPGERAFLRVLREVVGERALVFGKVRVADILTPRRGLRGQHWWQAFNRISAKHFDFVLCDPQDLAVLCVLELDDASHQRPERRARDAFLNDACASARLPLLRVPARARYPRRELQALLQPYLGAAPEHAADERAGSCPACGAALIERIARRGTHAGRPFLACSRFPACRHCEPLHRSQE